MAIIQCTFSSMSLHRPVNFTAVLPGDSMFPMPGPMKPLKTLYLLHGYGGGSMEWFKSSDIGDLSMMNNLAIIMPEGENHFYVNDMGRLDMYSELIGRELVEFTRKVFPLSDKREDTIIGGISMGGFGALINGLRFHDTFGHIVAISPALVKYDIANSTDEPNLVGATRGFFASVFGDLDKYPESESNPAVLAAHMKAEGVDLPSIYMACGKNDMLVMPARELHADLEKLGIEHRYVEGPGSHEPIFFYPHLRHGLSFIDLDRMPPLPNPFWIDG
ncbi:MAG: alpha/beta hydrolase-fold protein [Clostridiales bacterium]|nr:alpha/beta hydrolase-fold protein [Clostridiales bacterium]